MIEAWLAPAALTSDDFARKVLRAEPDLVRRLPVQMRAQVLRGTSVADLVAQIDEGAASGVYDPQGAFDAFQGQAPQ